jgi:hypothetical protein
MKPPGKFTILIPVLLVTLSAKGGSDPAPQPNMEISQGAQSTFNLDWEGVEGRTYFMEFSLNLVDWHYAPFLHFGEGTHQRGVQSNTDKFFMRLRHDDVAGINSLEDAINADFDGDGLNNLFEVMNGFNPYDTDSDDNGIPDGAEDVDQDGLLSITEQGMGTNPMKQDNPAVKLTVVVGN